MQINSDNSVFGKISFLCGDAQIVSDLSTVSAKAPFDDSVIEFLNDVSKELMSDRSAKAFSDVVTFAFWIRKASVLKLKERFMKEDEYFRVGRGIAFHIAPSNVPVNFAYTLVSGLLTGNANVVRVPSKQFPQVSILQNAFQKVLETHPDMKPYVILVRYDRNKEINDLFSSIADIRVIWGGDNTIAELRKSELPPRAVEITFADRFSLAVIDSENYLSIENKERVAEDFYNDTYFSDQNACTSPRIVVWTGDKIKEAKHIFWEKLHTLVEKKYSFQPIQAVNKLTSSYIISSLLPGCRVEPHSDNLIIRVHVPEAVNKLMDYRDNSGYFFEYDCKDILEIKDLCNDKRCQTIGYIGNKDSFIPLIKSGIKGVDRIVPVGKTMDFDLIWDGFDLFVVMTRIIVI